MKNFGGSSNFEKKNQFGMLNFLKIDEDLNKKTFGLPKRNLSREKSVNHRQKMKHYTLF